jgi:MoxR-like ATPase
MQDDIRVIQETVERESVPIRALREEVKRSIVGQSDMIEGLLLGLLTGGHILLEGVPGLAKTLAIRTLASAVRASFRRIQFTPDLLPADLTGTLIYNPREGAFTTKKGPIFTNLLLADEINRAPAKVQSALLEAMQERQVTLGDETYPLDDPFLVLATQNPIEQEGTYPLPEAQVDRFMLKLKVSYPSRTEEREILDRWGLGPPPVITPILTPDDLRRARDAAGKVYIDEKIKNYIISLVMATRAPSEFGLDLEGLIAYGASPRATIYLARATQAHAFLQGRGYVTPDDIKSVSLAVLRHRILTTYEAEAEGVTSDDIARRVLDRVEVP